MLSKPTPKLVGLEEEESEADEGDFVALMFWLAAEPVAGGGIDNDSSTGDGESCTISPYPLLFPTVFVPGALFPALLPGLGGDVFEAATLSLLLLAPGTAVPGFPFNNGVEVTDLELREFFLTGPMAEGMDSGIVALTAGLCRMLRACSSAVGDAVRLLLEAVQSTEDCWCC